MEEQKIHDCGCVTFGAIQMCPMHAAAPKLLEALEAMLVCLNQCTGLEDYKDTIWLDDVQRTKAVIRKAKGDR